MKREESRFKSEDEIVSPSLMVSRLLLLLLLFIVFYYCRLLWSPIQPQPVTTWRWRAGRAMTAGAVKSVPPFLSLH